MKRLRARQKFKLAQLQAAQLKEVIGEEEPQNKLRPKENELKQRYGRKRLAGKWNWQLLNTLAGGI